MKKILSVLLSVMCVLSVCNLGVSASEYYDMGPGPHDWLPGTPYFKGDANVDMYIDITDATAIQFHVGFLAKLDKLGEQLADVDCDKTISILDATLIQQREAKFFNHFVEEENPNVEIRYAYIEIKNIGMGSPTINQGETLNIVPQIEIHSKHYEIDTNKLEYRCMVEYDGEIIEGFSFYKYGQVTFAYPGKYNIIVEIEDNWGDRTREYFELEVVE